MSEAIAVDRRIVRVPPAVAFGSRFGKYKPEEEKDVRKADVKEDPALKELVGIWKLYDARDIWACCHEDCSYPFIWRAFSAQDIAKFVIAMGEFQGEPDFSTKAGHIISTLINQSKDREFFINISHISGRIFNLGERNTKTIIIRGDVEGVGEGMKGGRIVVEGNATLTAPHSQMILNGSIVMVTLVLPSDVGLNMRGGQIIVRGNAPTVGCGMTGGEIHIDGDIAKVGDVIHGKIYHKGVLIVGK